MEADVESDRSDSLKSKTSGPPRMHVVDEYRCPGLQHSQWASTSSGLLLHLEQTPKITPQKQK